MKIQVLVLFLFSSLVSCAQSTILKGHLINGKTGEPISNAKIYIVGGDSEDQTSNSGQYRLDFQKGINAKLGDEIEVYIKHEIYGFHKKRIPILKNKKYDIEIEQDNMVKITGSIRDEKTNEPIRGIEIAFISEENNSLRNEQAIVTSSDKYGGYSFLISKSLVGEQKYALLKFFDEKGKYHLYEKVLNIHSYSKIKLKAKDSKEKKSNANDHATTGDSEKIRTKDPIVLTPFTTSNYGTIDFDSGRGIKRHEFRSSPTSSSRAEPIADGEKVKILRTRVSESIDWYEVEYKGTEGWIKAKYINID